MKSRRFGLASLVVSLMVGATAYPALAQEIPSDRRVTITFTNMPVRTAIDRLFSSIRFKDYATDPKVQGTVSMRLTDVPAQDALRGLLATAHLSIGKENRKFVISPANGDVWGSRTWDGHVRVSLATSVGKPASITVSCAEPFTVRDVASQRAIEAPAKREVRLSAKGDHIEVAVGSEPAVSFVGPVSIAAKDNSALQIVSPKARHSRYRGSLLALSGTTLSLMNDLQLEDYVRGVVPIEVPSDFQPEAQKALTVAIRTYALRNLGGRRHSGYDLCDCTHCQGFVGASEDAAWVDKIVNETRGRVVVYDGKPISAVYSTDCGGVTQNNEDAGFGDDPWPYLRSVVDNQSSVVSGQSSVGKIPLVPVGVGGPKSEDYCAASPYHTWTKTFTSAELDRVFSRLRAAKIGKFQSMQFGDYDCSGRVRKVLIKGDKGEYSMRGGQLRELLGLSVIKSTRMVLTVTPDGKYVIDGKGYGHGVGLCTFGANGLAKSKKGITYVDILKHYYTGVGIERISLPEEEHP